jgi:hypothetical protein
MREFYRWLSGFADGEGCFIIHVDKPTNKYPTTQCAFIIALRADDSKVLHEIYQFLRIGNIYNRKATTDYLRRATKPQVAWWVRKKVDCQKLVSIFDKFPLRSKKLRDYKLWRRGVLIMAHPKYPQAGDLDRLRELRDRMKNIRKYKEPSNA